MTYDNPERILVSKIINSTKIISIFVNYDTVRKKILWFSRSVVVYFIFRIRRHMAFIYVFYRPSKFPKFFKKFKANLPLTFGFKCKHFCPSCSALMLLLSMHSNSKFFRCLLTFRIVRFAFPWPCRTTALEINNAVVVAVFIFLKHNALCGRLEDSNISTRRNQYRARMFVTFPL